MGKFLLIMPRISTGYCVFILVYSFSLCVPAGWFTESGFVSPLPNFGEGPSLRYPNVP